MNQQELLASLNTLHEELQRTDKVDPKTREALQELTDDIERLADDSTPTTAEDAAASEEGARSFLQDFEAEHPRLAEALGKLADTLANLGI